MIFYLCLKHEDFPEPIGILWDRWGMMFILHPLCFRACVAGTVYLRERFFSEADE